MRRVSKTDSETQNAIRMASLSGAFSPDQLVPRGSTSPSERAKIISALAGACEEFVSETEYAWRLKPSQRRAAFRSYETPEELLDDLRKVPTQSESDPFGQVLRSVLSEIANLSNSNTDRNPITESLIHASKEFEEVADAFEVAQLISEFRFIPPERSSRIVQTLQDQIRYGQRQIDLDLVRPSILFGRDYPKQKVSAFLRGKTDEKRPLVVTGIGGAGKSAMLASLMHGWLKKRDAPVMVWLDFDRALLRDAQPTVVTNEILRQLATYFQKRSRLSEADLNTLRSELESLRTERLPQPKSGASNQNYDDQIDRIASMLPSTFNEPWAKPLRKQPIALILDSFETVPPDALEHVLRLESELRASGLSRLRTIVSGRALPQTEDQIDDLKNQLGEKDRHVHLRGLTAVSGGRLLDHLDHHRFFKGRTDDLKRASELMAGHPLTLQILAKYIKDYPGTANDLLDELESDEGFRAEFAQSFLYTRILDRISNPIQKRLAHPGLVLRRLNADLVRLLLAEPCLGKSLDTQEARIALGDLERTHWLVTAADDPYSLRHRPDLRRLMLPGLFAGASKADNKQMRKRKRQLKKSAIEVCRSASDFFRHGPPKSDPAFRWWNELDETERHIESLYYSALAGLSDPDFDAETANSLVRYLDEDVDTLPPAWGARIKALRGEYMSDNSLKYLDDELSVEVSGRQIRASYKRGRRSAKNVSSSQNKPEREQKVPEAPIRSVRRSLTKIGAELTEHIEALRNIDVSNLTFLITEYLESVGQSKRARDLKKLDKDLARDFFGHPLWFAFLGFEALGQSTASRIDWNRIKASIEERYDFLNYMADLLLRGSEYDIRTAPNWEQVFYRADPTLASRIASSWLLRDADVFRRIDRGIDASLLSLFALDTQAESSSLKFFQKRVFDFAGSRLLRVMSGNGLGDISLGDVEALYRSALSVTFFGSDIIELAAELPANGTLLRGLSPELYSSIRSVLSDLSPQKVAAISREVGELTMVPRTWPIELRSAPEETAFASRLITPLIETADRYGLLLELCHLISETDKSIEPVIRMHKVITRLYYREDMLQRSSRNRINRDNASNV